jgi:hypothetical protein
MTRPRRLYTTNDGKFYYLIDGKKKFVKAPAGISQKQIARINIKNIVNAPSAKRIKKRRKRVEPAFGKKVGGVLQKSETGGLPLYFFKPQKNIPTLEDQAKASGDTNVEKLTKELLKGLKAQPSSSKIGATIAIQTEPVSKTSTGVQTEKRKKEKLGTEADSESEPRVPKKQISIDELVNVIGEVDRRGTVNFNNVKGYIDEFYKGQFTNITEEKFNRATDKYIDLAKTTPVGTPPPSMSPPMSKPAKKTGIATMKDIETDTETGNFVRNLMKQGGVNTADSGTETETIGGGVDDGLYNNEIEKIAKKRIKNYVPVIASDEINELPRYVARGDKRFGFVINTNPSTSDGSGNDGYRTGHWRSVYINNEDDYPTVEYFDPLTEGKMPPELVSMCRKIAMKMNPSMMFKYKQNMLRRQSKMTSNCGWHSVKFLDDRYNGIPWSEATGYDDYMAEHSSAPDDSHDGEKDISKYIKKYESYI